MIEIGITERGDSAIDTSWINYVKNGGYAILITKDPYKLINIIKQDSDIDCSHIILHMTITGMGGTWIEPNVPKTYTKQYRDKLFELLKQNNFAKIVLRVDPIVPTTIGIKNAIKVLKNYVYSNIIDEIRISFIDNYKHLRERGIKMPWNTLHAPLELRQKAYNEIIKYSNNITISICGEPDFKCTGCVSKSDLESFGINIKEANKGGYQRYSCCCLANKKELLNNRHPCKHGCLYCYWKD